MTDIDLLNGLFNDVLQGRQRRSSFAGFRLRTLAENPAKLITGAMLPIKTLLINRKGTLAGRVRNNSYPSLLNWFINWLW